jgi:hypothetical protein
MREAFRIEAPMAMAKLWTRALGSSCWTSTTPAWARIGLTLPGRKLIAWLFLVPGIHFAAQHFYAWVARSRCRSNRELCQDGTSTLHSEQPANSGKQP